MAARLTKSAKHKFRGSWAEQMRRRIDTSILCNRLLQYAKGELEMSPGQVRAAEILLNKTLPNLASVDHSGEIEHSYALVLEQCATAEEWEQQSVN